jgi:cobalt-zinc-cadmium efflux system protein
MVADVASSMGVLIAAIAIYLWQWQWVDPTASLLVAVLTGCSALPLIRESVEILLEYSPRSIDPDQVKSAILEFDQVKQVDDLHIWTVGSGQTLLCARLVTTELDGLARDQLTPQIQAHLRLHFGISQSILQIMSCQMLQPILLHPLFQQDLVTLIHQQAKTSTK